MPPKKHHFVPQMHLRLFSIDRLGKQLVAFDKEKRVIYLVAVEDAAAQGGYYTYETEAGEASLEFEASLAKIEGYAQPALDRLRFQQPPPFGGTLTVDPGDREWLAGYVALQHLRVPAQRERMQGMWNLLGTMQADIDLRNPESFVKGEMKRGRLREEAERMRDQALKALQEGRIGVTSDPVLGLHYIQQGIGPLTNYVKYMSWLLLKRFEPPYFLVSDNPVQLWPPDGHPPFMGVGFATPGVSVTMPIDPMTLFMAINLPTLPEKVVRSRLGRSSRSTRCCGVARRASSTVPALPTSTGRAWNYAKARRSTGVPPSRSWAKNTTATGCRTSVAQRDARKADVSAARRPQTARSRSPAVAPFVVGALNH